MSAVICVASGKSLAKDLDDFMAASTDLATLGSSVGCFVAGTVVKTEEGDKAIEEIKAGDKILSYEATTGRFAYKEVAEVIAHDGVTELAHVTIDGETIDSTTNHPYFVVGYGYVDAGNLIEGDTILLANGKEAKVEKVEIEFLTEPVTVYNFEVKDWHCYFVGEEGVLVHNSNLKKCAITVNAGGKNGNGTNNINGVPENEAVSWTDHGHKHFPNKNQSWKEIVESTKSGPAKYSLDIGDIEDFEREAWKTGTPVTNGKNWKVKKYSTPIGAANGKETVYIRIENSSDTIHGHPISKAEYNKLINYKFRFPILN